MDIALYLTFFISCIVAAAIQRSCGFGFGVFLFSILSCLMPNVGEATAIIGMVAGSQQLCIAARMHRHIRWRMVIVLGLASALSTTVAVELLARMHNSDYLKPVIGVVLIGVSVYFWFFAHRINIRATTRNGILAGTVSGLMGGFFSMQGPPAVLYFISAIKDKQQYMASAQAYFCLANVMATCLRVHTGFVTPQVLHFWWIGCIAALIGIWIGMIIFDKISAQTLRKIVYAFIGLCGVAAITASL